MVLVSSKLSSLWLVFGQAVIRLYNYNDDANSIFYNTSDVKFIVEDEEIFKVNETGVITFTRRK